MFNQGNAQDILKAVAKIIAAINAVAKEKTSVSQEPKGWISEWSTIVSNAKTKCESETGDYTKTLNDAMREMNELSCKLAVLEPQPYILKIL